MIRVVCAFALAACMAACCGCGASKQRYVAKGNQLFAAGKYEEAALNYRAAIQKDPAYGEAYYRLGLAAVKLNQARAAYDASLRAVQLLPGNMDAKKNYAGVCLSLYVADPGHSQLLYNQINKLSGEFLAADPNSYEGLMLAGYLASTDRQVGSAIEYFRRALRVDASDDGVVTELANLLIADGEEKEGERLAMHLIAEKKTSYGPAYDLMFRRYVKQNRPADAEAILQAKANNNPKNADDILELADYYRRENNTTAMTATLDRLLGDPKHFPQGRLWAGDFYLGLREYDQALRLYQEGADSSSNAKTKTVYEIRSVLALETEGKRAEALQFADRLRRETPKDNSILRTHADLLLAQGRKENATEMVREFLALTTATPGDASLHMQLGHAYRLQGNLENARNQFVQALQGGREFASARYEIAEIGLLQHRPQEAVQQAKEVMNQQPRDRRARLLYATGLIGTGEIEAAKAVLTGLIKDFPNDAEPQVQLGLAALAQRNYSQAIEMLSRFRTSGDARTFAALGSAYLHEKQFDQAHAVLSEGVAKWPGSPALLEQLGDSDALSARYEPALAEYQQALSLDPKSVELRLRMGEVSERRGDSARAIAYYQEAQRMAPGNPDAAVILAGALGRAGRTQQARVLYQNVARTHPDDAPALNNAAFFLADNGGDLDEALRLARTALAQVPGQPSFSDTVGYIYLKKGMLESAIQSFSTLAKRYPTSASFRYHLGLALFQKGEKAGARREFEAALANHPSAEETSRIRELLHAIG
jgi:tetratricopeptide (TPR) repeat protein